jgi:glycosyltransferase involved in cell wall biosynthesis
MSEEKGLTYLLDAARQVCDRFPKTRFVVVGEGPLRERLEAQARRLMLSENVIFTGFREDVVALLKTFRGFVLPSLSEGFPTVILYAMAASLPVVATNVGGIPEMVRDNITGLLAKPADAGSLAEAVCRLLVNPDTAAEMGRAGRRQVEMVFNLDKKIQETLAIYRDTFSANAHPLRVAALEYRYEVKT